jgi:3-deoxy-D-manno-octulosonic-acid transferase
MKVFTRKRLSVGKEDPLRFTERFAETKISRPDGKLMWLHGASVGEALSILPLLNTLKSRLPDWNFLLTTGTTNSATVLETRLPNFAVHQYIPWDNPYWVKKFFDHWQPDAVVWLESELWPNHLNEIEKRQIPACLINARMRPRSYGRWKRMRSLVRKMLRAFTFILTGAREYMPIFKELGGRHVHYIGSLKFGAQPLPVNGIKAEEIKRQVGNRFPVVFVSTHPNEEELAARVHQQLKLVKPDLLTIIVPRKVGRGQEIFDTLKNKNVSVSLRSKNEALTPQTDIYIADTIGETGLWYSLCPVAVIGGSFINFGGQNPLEGIHFGCAVLYGPSMYNFIDLCAAMQEAKAAQPVAGEEELISALKVLLTSPEKLEDARTASRLLANQNLSVIDSYADEIIIQLVQVK